jgi:hypothetical protein
MPTIHLTESDVAFVQACIETQETMIEDETDEMPVNTDVLLATAQMTRNDIEAQTGIRSDIFAPLEK